jgi:hypothetical protein
MERRTLLHLSIYNHSMGVIQAVNNLLENLSLGGQASVGAMLVFGVSFVLNYSQGLPEALVSAVITGSVVGIAYYLGLVVFSG